MNRIRYWYLKRINPDKALEELSRPAKGDFVVVHDGPSTWVRVRAEELDEYMRYLKDKADYCMRAYNNYIKNRANSGAVE